MLFAALTSAYIVRRAAGNWLEFPLPTVFFVSTAIILASSGTLHGAYVAYKRGSANLFKALLVLSLLLGIGFLVMQYQGWTALKEMGIPLRLNPSGDFVYAISWLHAAHVIGGLAALMVTVIAAFSRAFRVTPARKLRLELTMTYWHFVDLLWVYLIVFWTLQG